MEIQELKDKLLVFGWRLLYDLHPLVMFLVDNEVSLEDYTNAANEMFNEVKENYDNLYEDLLSRHLTKVCPKCKAALLIYPISLPKGRGNIHGYKHVFSCANCTYEEYGMESVRQLLVKLGKLKNQEDS